MGTQPSHSFPCTRCNSQRSVLFFCLTSSPGSETCTLKSQRANLVGKRDANSALDRKQALYRHCGHHVAVCWCTHCRMHLRLSQGVQPHLSMCNDPGPHTIQRRRTAPTHARTHVEQVPFLGEGFHVAPHTWLVFSTSAGLVGTMNLTALPLSQPLRILESLRLRQGRRSRPLARITTQGTSSVSVKVGGR